MHQLWAVLIRAQVCTRPDIAYDVGVLGRYLSGPGLSHMIDAKKVLRYLKGIKDFMLTCRWSDILDAIGYSDEDFIGCLDDRRSTSGYSFMMAGRAVLWKVSNRRLQLPKLWRQSNSLLPTYMSGYMGLRNFILGLVIIDTIVKPLKIFCDNSAAVSFSQNTESSLQSEHIDIKYLFVREKVVESHICVVHTPTEHMLADLLTKGLSPIVLSGACDSYGFIRVFCSIELVGVMCSFVYR